MATRLHFVKRARKADPKAGIAKGDSYFWWKFRYSGVQKSKTRPRPSQLINSPFLRTIAEIEEELSMLTVGDNNPDDVRDAIDNAKSELENLQSETQDSFDNMPEGLQQGDTGQMLEGRIESVEEMIGELDSIDTEQGMEGLIEELQGITYQGE